MKIIACLGNPDRKYQKTRHNIGFIIGSFLSDSYDISVNKKTFSSACGSGKVNGEKILLMFPHTYMNNSGTAVQQALNFYREIPENLFVLHDEIELPFGEYGARFGGGHRGHNGLRSIIDKIGTRDFNRFRFGVGRPDNENIPVADYLLSGFNPDEMDEIERLAPDLIASITSMIIKVNKIN